VFWRGPSRPPGGQWHSFKGGAIRLTDWMKEVVGGSGCWRRRQSLLSLFPFLLGRSPSSIGAEGPPRVGSSRTGSLILAGDRVKRLLDRRSDRVLQQEEFFEASLEDVNTVLEVGLDSLGTTCCGRVLLRRLNRRSEWIFFIEVEIRLIGKKPVHGYQDEMSEELLFDATLGLGVEVLDGEHPLADLVELFHAPSGMVDLHEVLDGISLIRIEKRRPQAKGSA